MLALCADGVPVGLADMPAVPKAAIAAVRDAIDTGAALAAPFHNGRRGHPVGFAANYRAALLALRGDQGARTILQCESAMLTRIKTDDPGIFADIDTRADLQTLNTQENTS